MCRYIFIVENMYIPNPRLNERHGRQGWFTLRLFFSFVYYAPWSLIRYPRILFKLYCIKFKKWKMNAIFTTSFPYNTYRKNKGKRLELWLLVKYIQIKVLSDALGEHIPWSDWWATIRHYNKIIELYS